MFKIFIYLYLLNKYIKMQRLQVSGAVRPLYGSVGVEELKAETCSSDIIVYFDVNLKTFNQVNK